MLNYSLFYYLTGTDTQYSTDIEADGTATATLSYVNKPNYISYEVADQARTSGVTSVYHHYNHLGSPMVSFTDEIVSGSPKISEMRDYDAYGKVIFNDVLYHAATPGFTGKELDKEGLSTASWTTDLGVRGLQLNYFGKRYFDPEIARWTSVDPVPQFWDMYNYCGDSPLNRTDPDGSVAPMVVSGVIAAGSDIAIQELTNAITG